MARAEADLRGYLTHLEAELGVQIEARQTARTALVRFSDTILEIIEAKMRAAGLRHQRILSGAGHDAQEFAAICPTAMIFVPGKYDGISHNPREYSEPEACARGVDVLLQTLLELAA